MSEKSEHGRKQRQVADDMGAGATMQPAQMQMKPHSQGKPDSLSRIQEINRKLILDAALDVFSTYGFRGSTIDQIALKAGMSKPNLLYYFRRKQDIYVTVLQETLQEWLDPLINIDPFGDPLQELAAYIRIKLSLSYSHPAASRLFANEVLQGAPAIGGFLTNQLRTLVDEKAALIKSWMAQGQLATVDPYHLIFSIWATTQHYADFEHQLRAVMGQAYDAPDYQEKSIAAVSAILLDGLRPR